MEDYLQSSDVVRTALGKTIADLRLLTDSLFVYFTDGTGVRLLDEGQQCCETRYMQTDDNLAEYIGSTLIGVMLRRAPELTCDGDQEIHEVQFLAVTTSEGVFTVSTHNKHSGCYGGFSVVAKRVEMEVANDGEHETRRR